MTILNLAWESIENEGPGIYNEAHLANIRKQLLAEEKEGKSVLIKFICTAPEWVKNDQINSETLQSRCSAALSHAQRRLKNCSAIAGWETIN